MILTLLIVVILGVFAFVLTFIPSLPPMPEAITTPANFILETFGTASSFLSFLYGQTLYLALLTAIIALFNFNHLYALTMWVWRKLPINSK